MAVAIDVDVTYGRLNNCYKHIFVHKLPERVGDSMSAVGRSGGRCRMYISLSLCVISAVQVRPSAATTSLTFSDPSPLRSINFNSMQHFLTHLF